MNAAIVTAIPAKPNALTSEVVEVTPELAQIWLGLNTGNRKVKPSQVLAFASDMAAGRWELNGEAIKLAGPAYKPTKLLDGQNRLYAVMKSGVTVPFLVVFGVPERTQSTMDSGTKRSVADNLSIAGFKNATIVAAAASIAVRVDQGRILGNMKATNATVEEYIYSHPDLHRSGEIASSYYKRTDVQPSLLAYTHYRFAQLDQGAAYDFWRDAAEKVGLQSGDPVLALTNHFADAQRERRRIPVHIGLSLIYRAWNARREDKPLRLLRVKSPAGGLIPIPDIK